LSYERSEPRIVYGNLQDGVSAVPRGATAGPMLKD